MKIFRLLLLSSLLLPAGLFAQSNYKPGLVVKANGDTLRGYIDYREWRVSPESINFKAAVNNAEVMKFGPGVLQGFEVTGMDQYVSYRGRISMDKNSFPDVPTLLDTASATATVFLRLKYNGSPVSLLTHEDDRKLRLFITEKGKLPEELIYHEFYTSEHAALRRVESYKAQLQVLASKYNSSNQKIIDAIENSKFVLSDIIEVLKKIDNDRAKAKEVNVRFLAGIGLRRTVSQIDGQNPFSGMQHTSYFPRVSIGADVFDNVYTQKIIFRLELAFSAARHRFNNLKYNTIELLSPISGGSYQFDQYTATLTPQIIYNIYNKENFKVFAGGGLGLNYSAYANQKLEQNNFNAQPYELQNLWLNFPFQAGVTLKKKAEVYASYSPNAAYTRYALFSVSSSIYELGLRFYLNRVK